ncbi:tetratricopeptide repeat protein [Aliarcobacter lanthieri]|uniref:tetratricopeptide repeat protein n=1 Tax=Aliarcobacter lanthieri TaxID=1355374 RepID=UPI0004BB7E9E|nr:tetratricopeptide repeat protein [Aliarcobacter lanthieri]
MKNKLLKKLPYLFILSNILLANENYSNEHFQKAIESYQNRLFQDSYILLQQYTKENKLSSDTTFILARSAYEIGKFSEALSLYKNMLKENPKNNRIKLELAQTYFQLKQYEEARILYEEVLKEPTLPENVKKNIELTLNSLNNKSQKNFIKTTLSFGYGFDSNVNNNSNDDLVYWGNIPLSIEDKKSDQVSEYILSLNHTYKIKDNLTLNNKFSGYMQKYNHEKYNDLSLVVFGTALSYYSQKSKLSLAFDYNYVWLDNSSYLSNYILTPSFDYRIDANLLYKSKIKIIKKDFKQNQYEFRDSTYYELQNTLVLLTQNFGMNSFSLNFGTDDKDDGKHYNVDKDFISLKYDNMYPLTKNTILINGIELYKDIYKENEPLFYKDKRQNDKIIYDLGILHSINKNLSIGANFRYINNQSNQNIYEYDKYVVKSNIYYSF